MTDDRTQITEVDSLEPTTELLIIGGGPAGLMAALSASEYGVDITLIDENDRLGGQLIKQTHMFFGSHQEKAGIRGIDIGSQLSAEVKKRGIRVLLNSTVIGYYEGNQIAILQTDRLEKIKTEALVVATGAAENIVSFPNNDLPGVYGAGAVQTLMNVYGVRPGKRVLMVGSGNIGLIVSYQLLQAGVSVVAVIEALPKIGGYLVHASKIARTGVPILVSHTIKEAIGKEEVEGAVIVKIDKNWRLIAGTEKKLKIDTICLAVGLSPLTEILWQAGCEMYYIPELGGHVAWHNEDMETSVQGIYVAGDVSGIEEASTAMLEGQLAGLAAAESIKNLSLDKEKAQVRERLSLLRAGPFGEKPRIGKQKLQISADKISQD
ncbi:MAG: NAD(P)/FAD-dependent oxidoreductase [Candidatus Edwardsbacteria bacterium]